MCLYPKVIKNRKYTSNKKNGGEVPPLPDERVKYVPVGCGNCMECRKQKARGWQVRLLEDIQTHTNGKFITLTFSNEWLRKIILEIEEYNRYNGLDGLEGHELDNQIATWAMRKFNERYRKEHGKALRHWMVTELGHNGTENIHLHGIIWTDEKMEDIERLWKYGWIWKGKRGKAGTIVNYVNGQTVNYIIKYVTKIDEVHKTFKSKILTSPGIGANYIGTMNARRHEYKGKETRDHYKTSTGHKMSLPIYYRNKIYSEKQREELWLQRLDKEERWVGGELVKIGTEAGWINYNKLLKWYQDKNISLGYGTDIKDWSRETYEKERRKLMIKARIGINTIGMNKENYR